MDKTFRESVVVYHSEEDECWIAHGLHTDQIGTGQTLVHALADLMTAVHQVYQIASEDPSVAFFREAPPEVQKMSLEARPLPKEMSEVAYKMAFGQWPDYLKAEFTPTETSAPFKVEVSELACG